MFNNTTANISTFFENHAISPQKTLCHLDLTLLARFKTRSSLEKLLT